jgi:hypothetical protein
MRLHIFQLLGIFSSFEKFLSLLSDIIYWILLDARSSPTAVQYYGRGYWKEMPYYLEEKRIIEVITYPVILPRENSTCLTDILGRVTQLV